MRPAHRDVVITGLGAVSALGDNCDALWSAVDRGVAGISPIRRFSTSEFSVPSGATVAACAEPQRHDAALAGTLCLRFALQAAREALAHAGLSGDAVATRRVALVFGTGLAELAHPIHLLAESLGDALGVRGPRLTVSTACSSSTGAIGIGRELLAMNVADVVIAGGADVLSPEVFAGFHALGVLSPARCAPFSRPFGTTLGEGAGFVVLERGDNARGRGAAVVAALTGYGLSGDGWHETSPDPQGLGVERAIRGALADAALSPEDVGYVNAHGSGTEANDPAEWLGIRRALGARAEEIPVSSTKGALGHAQGAAGVLEAIVTILAMQRGVVPPTLNGAAPRAHAPTDPVLAVRPRAHVYARAISTNSAFGGANAALVLTRHDEPRGARARRPVRILGVGVVGPHGLGLASLPATAADVPPSRTDGSGGRVPAFDIERLLPSIDPRGLDPMSRYLTAAALLALGDAAVVVRGPLRGRSGLLIGQLRASPTSLRAFQRSIEERGLAQLSAPAFARIVLNAAAGSCSKLLSLRGPLSAITTGEGSGLAAIVLASEMLGTRDDVDLMIAGGADERDTLADAGPDGAVCVLLARDDYTPVPAAGAACPVQLAGWGLAGPGELDAAIGIALTSVGGLASDALVVRAEQCGWTTSADDGASTSALAVARAVLALRAGAASQALVTCDRGASMSAALLLTR